ncbi:MAG: exo-beta-N-acetylmuramidase NamZ domain-containing protein [Pyrinomonadaceae bacterium]
MKNFSKLFIAITFISIGFSVSTVAQRLPFASPESVQMSSAKLRQIDTLVEKSLAEKMFPGAVVLVGRKGKVVFKKAYGNRSLVPTVEKMTPDTVFDLASLTKIVSTATSVMELIERGKVRLNDRIERYIPEIEDPEARKVTVQELLTHISGYRPDFDLGIKWQGRAGLINALKSEKLINPRGTKFVYSDINYEILGEIIERVTRIDQADILLARSNDLRMPETQFYRFDPNNLRFENQTLWDPTEQTAESIRKIAPTEYFRGQQSYLGESYTGSTEQADSVLRGLVHDPTSFRMEGVAGHAGVFSDADDLARFCQMILNGGILNGYRVMSDATVALMTKPFVVSDAGETRGLGWDIDTGFSSNRGELYPLGSFGHTGFTGTSFWIDPVSQTYVVFLSNRVHPDGKGSVGDVRGAIATVVASSVIDVTAKQVSDFEAKYYATVAGELAKFKARLAEVKKKDKTNGIALRKPVTVLNGIDVLEKEGFTALSGLRIGLVTNHTGRDLQGNATIDVLHNAKNVKLKALFSPEHGIRGELDQENIVDTVDKRTGLTVFSLYGETRRPKPEQLKDLDAIVFDIQDVGARFYTYISTLRAVLEEASKADLRVFVLDRPNPINGVEVEGPLADSDMLSFIAPDVLPVRHGMTTGELATFMNSQNKIGAKLNVVKMQGWKREMWFDETGQTWVNPSPNMRSLTEATLYPGIGLLETTNLSVGRGTDTPFEVIGAPWLDGRKLSADLNSKGLPGIRFVPIRFKPNASVFKDENLGGVNFVITDRESFDPVLTGFSIANSLRVLYPGQWQYEKYLRLLVNKSVQKMIASATSAENIVKSYNSELQTFKKVRALNLLY